MPRAKASDTNFKAVVRATLSGACVNTLKMNGKTSSQERKRHH